MVDHLCGYAGDRGDLLVAYLYDDIDPATRASFDAHLAICSRCRNELADLRGVRAQLGKWAPPEPAFATSHKLSAISHWWNVIPAWAQVAAALLFLGVAAGIANLDVRYNHDGLTVRTGWSKAAVASSVAQDANAVNTKAAAVVSVTSDPAPWRADLTALEQQLRREFRSAAVAGAARPMNASVGVSDTTLLRRVRTMIDESERRQQTECGKKRAEGAKEEGRPDADCLAQQAAEQRAGQRRAEPEELHARIDPAKQSLRRDRLPQADLVDLVEGRRAIAGDLLKNQQQLNHLVEKVSQLVDR